MKNLLAFIIVGFLLPVEVPSQPLWQLTVDETDLGLVGADRSVGHLQSLLTGSDTMNYLSYARVMAVEHGSTQKQFILDKISFFGDESWHLFTWWKYCEYEFLRGYLGEPAALAGMHHIVGTSDFDPARLNAIHALALAGQFNYLNIVEEYLPDPDLRGETMKCLRVYSQNAPLQSQVKADLTALITSPAVEVSDILVAWSIVWTIDGPHAVQLLQDRYASSTGSNRQTYFDWLNGVDKDAQPGRTMESLPLEPDELQRQFYFPWFNDVQTGQNSRLYCEASFIKFTVDWLASEPSPYSRDAIKSRFYDAYLPIVPSEATQVDALLSQLATTLEEVSTYGWISDIAWVSVLGNKILSAQVSYDGGDLRATAQHLLWVYHEVNHQYLRGADGDTKSVTIDGWKFLYHRSKYILDRLPNLTSDQINLPEGWSLTSVPVDQSYFSKQYVLPGAASAASRFNGSAYVTTDPLSIGPGYWIKYDQPKVVTDYGLNIPSLDIPVVQGWNIIGSITEDIPIGEVSWEDGAGIASSYFGFESGAYTVATILEAGKGYWIKSAAAGHIVLGGTSSGSPPPGEQPPPGPGAPSTPTLQSPANGATGIPATTTLSWFPAQGATTYNIQVSTNPTFTTFFLNQTGLSVTSKNLSSLQLGTTYHWRVSATNQAGTSYWTTARSFTTVSPPTPPAPTLISPGNFATGVSTTPVVSWNSSSGATSYRLQVAQSASFNPLTQDYQGLTSTSKVLGTLSNNTTYFWRVNASNGSGTSGWSSAWRFTTQAGGGGGGCEQQSSVASLDEFTVGDSRGNKQNFFIRNQGRPFELGAPGSEFPPDPPPGIFLARPRSRKLIEEIPPNDSSITIPIHVRDVSLPITIHWDLKKENKVKYWIITTGPGNERIRMNGKGSHTFTSLEDETILIEAQGSDPCDPN